MRSAAVIIVAYLLGSIPFGYLIVRASQGTDVRESGSGGTGATNVSRRAGKLAGVITLLLDALKGLFAVLIAKLILGWPSFIGSGYGGPALQLADERYWWVAAAAVAAIVGHVFPVWLRFRGGKGVATGVGVFLALAPTSVLLAGIVFLLVGVSTRYVSLASTLAAAAIPICLIAENKYLHPVPGLFPILIAAGVSAVLIIVAHRGNIARLMAGTESKFR